MTDEPQKLFGHMVPFQLEIREGISQLMDAAGNFVLQFNPSLPISLGEPGQSTSFMQFAEFIRDACNAKGKAIAGSKRYRADLAAGRIGKEVHTRSWKDLPPGRPKIKVNIDQARELLAKPGMTLRKAAKKMEISYATLFRALKGKDGHTVA